MKRLGGFCKLEVTKSCFSFTLCVGNIFLDSVVSISFFLQIFNFACIWHCTNKHQINRNQEQIIQEIVLDGAVMQAGFGSIWASLFT